MTIKGIPCLWAMSASSFKSIIFPKGLPIDSQYNAFVFSSIAASRVDLTQNIIKNSELYTSAKVSIACIHSETFKPQRIPKLIKQQMEIL